MSNTHFQIILNELRVEYMRQTGGKLTNFGDPKFGSWLKEIDKIGNLESNSQYVIVNQKEFSQSIIEGYLEAINQVSKSIDKRGKEKTFTKLEVLNLISDAFDIAKTEGEKRIRKTKEP